MGPQLATILQDAKYSPHRQFETLMVFYSTIIPRLGKAPPTSGLPHWQSSLTEDGTPIEYSWKWNTADETPEIRYSFEAIGDQTGTDQDPLNKVAANTFFDQLKPLLPSLDTTWLDQFADLLCSYDKESFGTAPLYKRGSILIALEHLSNDIGAKAYLLPTRRTPSDHPTFARISSAVRTVTPENQALDEIMAFVSSNAYGATLRPQFIAVDCVKPSKSRLKYYIDSPKTSFASVRAIMTLGGRISGVEKDIDELAELYRLVFGLDEGYSWEDDLPNSNPFDPSLAHEVDFSKNMGYHFDIAPGASVPTIKVYFPVNRFCRSDNEVVRGLTTYLKSRGRGQYVDGYDDTIKDLRAPHDAKGSDHRVHVFVACAFQKGTLSLTSYLNPGIHYLAMKNL